MVDEGASGAENEHSMACLCRASRRGRRCGARPERCRARRLRIGAAIAALSLLAAACASLSPPGPRTTSPARFRVGRDSFAFANLVRAERPGWNDGFANYCILMTRAANQFFRFARFAPDRPPVAVAEYRRLVGEVLARHPWSPPAEESQRVVIPGYPDLHAFSAAHEGLLKAALGSNILSIVHWRTWRVAIDYSPAHQARLAGTLVAEIDAGRPVPLMITNFPNVDVLNHVVLVIDHRPSGQGTEFLAYDPNDPGTPLAIHFDAVTRSFWVGPLTYSPPGRVRAFRLFTSPLL
jgi:hypothetical protein